MARYGSALLVTFDLDAIEPSPELHSILRFNYMRTAERLPQLPAWHESYIRRGPIGVDSDGHEYRQWAWIVEVGD